MFLRGTPNQILFLIYIKYPWRFKVNRWRLYDSMAFGVEPHLITTIVSMFWVVLEEHSQHRSERGYRNYGYVDRLKISDVI